MFVSFLAALSAAFVVLTVVQTWTEYRSLPERVPVNYGWDGEPIRFGPRPLIWLLVVVQCAVAAITGWGNYALGTHAPGTHGTLLGSLIVSTTVLGMLWWIQTWLIRSAKSAALAPRGEFLLVLATGVVIIVLDAVFVG